MRTLSLDPETIELHFPPRGLEVPRRHPSKGYPSKFLKIVRRYEAMRVKPLSLPETPWRVYRHDNGSVRKTYGDADGVPEFGTARFVSVTRDEEGVLVRHTTSSYRWETLKGELAAACLSPSGHELATLIYFADVPEGPQVLPPPPHPPTHPPPPFRVPLPLPVAAYPPPPLGPQVRLQLLELSTLDWLPMKATFPMVSQLAPLMAMGPLMDVPASDYIFILVDNAVRVLSLGSGTQVASLRPVGTDLEPALDSLAVGGDGRHVAVGCSSQQRFYLYTIVPPAAGVRVRHEMMLVRAGSARLDSVPMELRVREVEWYLGRNAAGHLSTRTHVGRFMRREALRIVELSLEIAAPSAPGARTSFASNDGVGGDRSRRRSRLPTNEQPAPEAAPAPAPAAAPAPTTRPPPLPAGSPRPPPLPPAAAPADAAPEPAPPPEV